MEWQEGAGCRGSGEGMCWSVKNNAFFLLCSEPRLILGKEDHLNIDTGPAMPFKRKNIGGP
jgi:hypothetical protein